MITKNSNFFKYMVKQIPFHPHRSTLIDSFTITDTYKEYSITDLIIDSVQLQFSQTSGGSRISREGEGVNHKGGFTSNEN